LHGGLLKFLRRPLAWDDGWAAAFGLPGGRQVSLSWMTMWSFAHKGKSDNARGVNWRWTGGEQGKVHIRELKIETRAKGGGDPGGVSRAKG